MKRLLLIMGATVLLVAPYHAQAQNAQTQTDMTTSEFRQVLVDMGSYLDAHKGTNLASQFAAIPDETLSKIYPAVSNPRQLQRAVAALKQDDAKLAATRAPQSKEAAIARATPLVAFPGCTPNSIIDNSPGAQCTPAYPDPTNGSWQAMVNPLITFGAFSPTDYPDVAMQTCGLTVESNLVQVVSALNGTVTVAAIACGALPPIASNVCFGAVAVVGVAGAVSQGLLADCSEQDGNVNTAEIDAAFHNTVTIFNALGTDTATINGNLATDTATIDGNIAALDTHLTNVNNQIAGEFITTDTLIQNDFNLLTTQIAQGTALLQAYLKQIMKLELTPNGQKVIDPPILTCTGTNCPNVLAACPAAGCSWNNVGPLP
jgi:hypothetical protein